MVHGHNGCVTQCNTVKTLKLFFLTLLCLLIALLNGCSTTSLKDGPPPYDVDVSKIPNATPKKECLAKYGNMPSYKVYGKNYQVMRSAKDYEAKGTASWYGTLFHKKRTSSGEPYDMLAMTAAHRTLPLPTYVEVTNLKNNKKVIVKVNDRGPFSGNRLIDLSYVAAKKLGMIGHGTTNVHIRAIDTDTNVKNQWLVENQRNNSVLPPSDKKVYLQVGAFKNKLYAEKLRKRLIPIIKAPIQVTPLAETSKKIYRVKIGPIKDYATENSIKKKLLAIGLEPRKKV